MTALNGLNTASALLQQIAAKPGPSTYPQNPVVPIAPIASEASASVGSAGKSVSSAIFNAVTDLSEKLELSKQQEKSVEAVLDYVDRTYTRFEETGAGVGKVYEENGEGAVFQQHVANAMKIGENWKALVNADPEGIHKMLKQIRAGRPDISIDSAIGIMIAELGNVEGRQSVFPR